MILFQEKFFRILLFLTKFKASCPVILFGADRIKILIFVSVIRILDPDPLRILPLELETVKKTRKHVLVKYEVKRDLRDIGGCSEPVYILVLNLQISKKK